MSLTTETVWHVSAVRSAEGRAVRRPFPFGCSAKARLVTLPDLYSHKSVLEYLHANNFTDAFNSLKSDTGLDYTPDPKSKYAGLLEKKWTSVIRLQKKVCTDR